MNKGELVEALAGKTDLSKSAAQRALDSVVEIVTGELSKGGSVQIVGFGTFEVRTRSARVGFNPRDRSKKINIPARKVPAFKAGRKLKDAVA